jgi:hypothetical protein
MKRFIPAFLLLLALLVGYWAWPFFELRALAAALQARDVTAINEDVDYARLRRSFTEQIIGAYLHVTGRASKLGAFGSVATAIGASIVDPWVSQIVNPENLAELLRGGTISSLESNWNRPARETARSDCGRTGKEISVTIDRPHFSLGQAAHPRRGAADRGEHRQAAAAICAGPSKIKRLTDPVKIVEN